MNEDQNNGTTQENKKTIEVSFSEPARGDELHSISIILNLSFNHIQSAAFFTRKAGEIERGSQGKRVDDVFAVQHWAFVTGAIVSSVFFLEAGINEIFHDCGFVPSGSPPIEFVKELPEATRRALGDLWKNDSNFNRKSILAKYQEALGLGIKVRFDDEDPVLNDVKIVIELRHYLAHYKPEAIMSPTSLDFTENEIPEMGRELMIRMFDPNPFTDINTPFPNRFLGHGLAEWCVNASLRFVDEFSKRMGMTPRYNNIRHELSTS